jgi:hypothetical protein
VNETVLIDTGFWIALFDERDPMHSAVTEREGFLELATPLVPWPTVYETLRTRFVRRPIWMAGLDQLLRRLPAGFVDDGPYRASAYALAVEFSVHRKRPISMVDVLCRLLIEDPNVRIDYMLTTNPDDFADVCGEHGVELL